MAIYIEPAGPIHIAIGGVPVPELVRQRLPRAVLVYLAVQRSTTRSELYRVFRRGRNSARSRRALQLSLEALQRALGEEWLHQEGDRIEVDHTRLVLASGKGRGSDGSRDSGGGFLLDFELPGRPGFAAWVAAQRERRAAEPAELADVSIPFRFLAELKRRQVFRVAWGFSVAAFVIMQGADLILPVFFPPWAYNAVVVVMILGFPVAVLLAWVFELTPDGRLLLERGGDDIAPHRARRSLHTRLAAVAAASIVVAAVGLWSAARLPERQEARRLAAEPDSARWVILPFERDDDVPAEVREADLLFDALREWQGIGVVDPIAVREALAGRREGVGPADGQTIAARLGAGRYVLGSIARGAGSLRVHAAVYDTQLPGGEPVADAVIELPASGAPADSAFRALGSLLLFGKALYPEDDAPGTRSVAARRVPK